MIWLALLTACSSPEPRPDRSAATDSDVPPTDTDADHPTEITAPPLTSPAEAVDLDPADDVLHVELTAAPAKHQVHEDGPVAIAGFAYNGQTPGPTLRAKVGDLLIVDLTNAMDVATTIHWHGVAAPYEMDGVTWQYDPIGPGDSFTYTFVLNAAGTFWYHPHFDTERQVDLGLYGALIVEDPREPAADDELVLVFDTWEEAHDDEEEEDAADHHGLDPTPVEWTVNSLDQPAYTAAAGTRVRVRMINVSNTGYLDMPPQRWIGGDQGLLPAAVEGERLLLGPGDRIEVEWSIGEAWTLESERYSLGGGSAWGDPFPLVSIAPDPAGAAPAPIPWPFPGGDVTPDPGYTDITYVFTGDSGGDGWMINGELYPDVTVEQLALDTTAIIEVRNLSPSEHPFHLHGHHFEVLAIDGTPPAHRTVEDTLNIRIGEAVRLRVHADNPGYWMTHCHILPHAHQGMMTVLEVAQ